MDRRQIEQLHEQASEFYVRGEFLEAVATWKQILEIDPDDEKAQEGLRVSSNLQASAAAPPPDGFLGEDESDRLKACLTEVEVRIDSGDLHGAMRAAELLRVEHPEDPSVLSVLAKAYSLAGESDKAAEMMAKFLASSPEYAAAAALLEECRQVSPHESHLGSVVVRDGDSGAAAEAAGYGAPAGLLLEEPAAVLDDPEPEEAAPAARASAKAVAAAEEKGLALPDATSFRQAESKDAPAAALRDRVSELLRQARAAMADGRHDDALGFVSRILILDDGNDDAMRLEEEIRKHSGAAERDLDRLITEGAHLFDLGRHDESRQIFLQVLEKSPSHREAVAYLERVDAQMARAGAPTIATAGGRARGKVWAPPSEDAAEPHKAQGASIEGNEDLLAPMESEEGAEIEGSPEPEAEVAVAPRTPFSARRIPDLIGPRFFRLVVIGLAGILVAVVASWWVLRGASGDSDAASDNTPAQHVKAKKKAAAPEAPAPVLITPEQRAAKIADYLAKGDDAVARKDYQAAIVAYNEVVRLDPEETTVRAKILAVGEEYKKNRSDLEKLEKARTLFKGGEYESGLRMIYRLPEGMLPADVWERYKLTGWYNMGVVALRGANCKDAVAHLTEAQALAPNDPGVRAARDLADRCEAMSSDRSFYNRADGLPFRELDPPSH